MWYSLKQKGKTQIPMYQLEAVAGLLPLHQMTSLKLMVKHMFICPPTHTHAHTHTDTHTHTTHTRMYTHARMNAHTRVHTHNINNTNTLVEDSHIT